MVRKASSKLKCRTRGGHGKVKVKVKGVSAEEEEEEEDRIGILPDEILSHILSCLPTKDAVRTSILSNRWRYIWTSVTSIDIDDRSLLSGDLTRFKNHKMKVCFVDFVDMVLRQNGVSCLRKFSLHCDEAYNPWRVSEWISTVVTRNVEVIDLKFNLGQEVELLPSFFTCRTLVFFKITCLRSLEIPTSVFLPSLKILHLMFVDLVHEDSMRNLLDGCPIIEELHVVSDFYDDIKTLFVRSSSLKRLKIDYRDVCDNRIELGIVVDATNLELLDLICIVDEQCDLNSLSSLVEVKFDVCHYHPDSLGGEVYGNKSVELLRKLSNTKNLCLYYHAMKILEYAHLDNLPVFHNLVRLELHMYESSWQALPYFLEKSPNIITFVLCKALASPYDEHEWHQEFRNPNCLMLYLKEIDLISFKGSVEEMKMVGYFLKNAVTLKKLSIRSYYSGSKDEEWEILKKLLMFPRSSSSCQIAFN